jgi:predicted nucleotidyltransferase
MRCVSVPSRIKPRPGSETLVKPTSRETKAMADTPEVRSPPTPGGLSAIDRVVEGLMAYEPEKIILFGSAARGEADEYSDLDLIVIKASNKRFVERLVEVTAYLPRDVAADVFVYTPQEIKAMIEEENPFIEQALKDGIVLYEKSQGNGPSLAGPG